VNNQKNAERGNKEELKYSPNLEIEKSLKVA